MIVLSFVLAVSLTPGASLRLAQKETEVTFADQVTNIQTAKADIRNKIDSVKQKKKSVTAGGTTDKELDKILDRLNKYLKYLDYLTDNPSLDVDDKLLTIKAATDNVMDMSDKVFLEDATINFSGRDLSGDFDTVTQSDMGLTYNPITSSIGSGTIGSNTGNDGGGTTGGGTTGGGTTGGGTTGGGTTGGGTTGGGGGGPASP